MDEGFNYWLSGFFDGEGCFSIDRNHRHKDRPPMYACRAAIRLRCDDRPVLESIAEGTGLGCVVQYKRSGNLRWDSKPTAVWHCTSRPDCLGLVEIFDAYPLRAKKARDYAIWREAVLAWDQVKRGNQALRGQNAAVWARMSDLKHQLAEGRRFQATAA